MEIRFGLDWVGSPSDLSIEKTTFRDFQHSFLPKSRQVDEILFEATDRHPQVVPIFQRVFAFEQGYKKQPRLVGLVIDLFVTGSDPQLTRYMKEVYDNKRHY
jgi:hypothetical protein